METPIIKERSEYHKKMLRYAQGDKDAIHESIFDDGNGGITDVRYFAAREFECLHNAWVDPVDWDYIARCAKNLADLLALSQRIEKSE